MPESTETGPEAKRLKIVAAMPSKRARSTTLVGELRTLHERSSEIEVSVEPKTALLCTAPADDFEIQIMDWHKDHYGTKSGKILDKEKVKKARELEMESLRKHKVYEPIQLDEARRQGLEIVYSKWLDDEKPTADDPEAVRSRIVATQLNTYAREDVTQATPPTKASRIVLSMAASRTNEKGQHDQLIARHDVRVAFFHAAGSGKVVLVPVKGLERPGVGWRALKAWYGTREASKCWGNEVTDTLLHAGCRHVGVIPMMFVHDSVGFTTECHGDDFLSSGDATALDELDTILTGKWDTKTLARIGPPAYGGQVLEGKHLGRIVRWTPQGYEWQANPKHATDLLEITQFTSTSRGSSVPATKATAQGRRDALDALPDSEVQSFRQAAGTGLYLSIDRPTIQFAMGDVMAGMANPQRIHQLQMQRVARYVLEFPEEVWLYNYQSMPKELYVYTDSDWAADKETRKSVYR